MVTPIYFMFLLCFCTSQANPANNRHGKGTPNDIIPLPEWDRYLKSVVKIVFGEKNKKFAEYAKSLGLGRSVEDEIIKKIEVAFDRMIPEEDRKILNGIKKKEIDAIRRRLIPIKKHLSNDLQMPSHLNITKLQFSSQDMGLLIKANMEHVIKFNELRETDFKKYEMEKKFIEEQRLKHIKTEEKRKKELEKIEAEKAKRAAVKVKHPMSNDSVQDVWVENEKLPKEEFDAKTFFAISDLDSNGFLDVEEVRIVIQKELENAYKKLPGDDLREFREEMERMREHIYKEVDKNGDLMIDFDEFMEEMNDRKANDKTWDTLDNDSVFNDTDFEAYEKERISEIRDDIASGKKPDGYNYEDVPMLDDNFLNETHIKYGGVLMKVDESPHSIREKVYKEYEMKKQFEEEQLLKHIKDPLERRKKEIQLEIEKKKQIKSHEPLSPEQLQSTWKEQDKKNESDFDLEKFYNLHDIDGDKIINRQELRLMIITELKQAYERANKTVDSVEFREDLERQREKVFEDADTDRDEFISKAEFIALVNKNKNKHEERKLHKESEYTEEEYRNFHDERVLEIRKMIANGVIPDSYNYSDVPLLSGNFINITHVQRNGVLIEIYKQNDRNQKVKDFKRFRMEERFKFEQKIKSLSPEDQKRERENFAKKRIDFVYEQKEKHKNVSVPMSDKQEKEVWEKEDKMEPDDFNLEKYFKLHDVDSSGKWNKQEVIASLMQELDKMYPLSDKDPSIVEKRKEEMDKWLAYVFGTGDLDKDDQIDFAELEYLNKLSNDNKETEDDENDDWKDIEDDYTSDEFKRFEDERKNNN